MNPIILTLASAFGLAPFNRHRRDYAEILDYFLMVAFPILYLVCYFLVTFSSFGLYQLPECNSICRLSNILIMHLGCFLYVIIQGLALLRRKNFYIEFNKKLMNIDKIIEKCQINEKPNKKSNVSKKNWLYFSWTSVLGIFAFTVVQDIYFTSKLYPSYFYIASMINSFPFVAASIVQGQFICYVSMITNRLKTINELFQQISNECDAKNAPLEIFNIDSDEKSEFADRSDVIKNKNLPKIILDGDTESSDEDDSYGNKKRDKNSACEESIPADGITTEGNLPHLFKLHDKILELSVLTNSEFGPQCVPYTAVCFIVSIFAIFLETKVIFVVGGKSSILDYSATIFMVWTICTIMVTYFVLRLCCSANTNSKQSAMIVHEIMQKKPSFMLANDLFYNKMKSFTLQFLHWEGYFQFNGIGLFALDYTFIFSSVSAATSYLIVLLQFDMTAILKSEGLTA